MTSNLEVETDVLQGTSAASAAIAQNLRVQDVGGVVVSGHASGAGVAAVDSVSKTVRLRQADRIAAQAAKLSSASAQYADGDRAGADAVDVAI